MNPNLEMQVSKIQAGLWTVTYGRKAEALDIQEAAFVANDLDIVSPALLGFLRTKESQGIFNLYSRTSSDVLYDDRTDVVVVVPDGSISRIVGGANLVDAHRRDREYVIPKNQRDLVYAMVDEMLKNGIAFIAPDGQTRVKTSEFEINDLTSRLFSNKRLGIEAQEYGNWVQSKGINTNIIFMDEKDYSRGQNGPYLNRLRVYGSDGDFDVFGDSRNLGSHYGAFGVRFKKTAEGGSPKK